MYLLARHFRLSQFASFISGLAFSLCGYLANTGHPHTLDSAIWLPLIVLFFLRAVEAQTELRAIFEASIGGIALGMAVLAGGLHRVSMDAIVIASMPARLCDGEGRYRRVLTAAITVAVFGFLLGAVQLLPSVEYGSQAYRWFGGPTPIRSLQKIPYEYLGGQNRLSPRAIFAFLFGAAESGNASPGNYFGVLPFIMSIVGVWRCWRDRWVKYFALLAGISFLYSWGSFSLIHGWMYLLPILDAAREAARFIHLTQFAMAILAGFGIDYLYRNAGHDVIRSVRIATRWIVIFLAVVLAAASLQRTIAVDESSYFSFFLIGSTYVLLELIRHNRVPIWNRALLAFVLLWDAYAFDWVIRNKEEAQSENQDHLAELVHARNLAAFFKSQPAMFRIHFDGELPPNLGDVYSIQMTGGMSATMLTDYAPILGNPQMDRLLNVRYTLRKTAASDKQLPVFSDGMWNVYENPDCGPRAWLVQKVEVNASAERPLKRLNETDFDPTQTAILEKPLDQALTISTSTAVPGTAQVSAYTPTSMSLNVQSHGQSMLVLSEVFYPGWNATVNGASTPVLRVDGFLRGVVVPDGSSTVVLIYRPTSVRLGAFLTFAALLGSAILGISARLYRGLRENSSPSRIR
jgi:hypothetical protein